VSRKEIEMNEESWGISGGGVDFRTGSQRPFMAQTYVWANGKWCLTWGQGDTEDEAMANALANAQEFFPGYSLNRPE
jgi:hypothetical protein